jgi:photosystem II stability/assembly factor-like uncharacterized protein
MSRLILALALLSAVGAAIAVEPLQSVHEPLSSDLVSRFWAVPKHKAPEDPAIIYVSPDSGETWDATVPLPTNSIEPPSITGFAHTWDHVYVATDGEGVFRTVDGRSWEKWNEADVSIRFITGNASEPVVVITEHGATFALSGSGFENTFVQVYSFPLTATAVSFEIQSIIGTSDGKVYSFMGDELFDTTDGVSGRPGPLPGAIRQILHTPDHRVYVVEDSEGRNRVYTKVSYSLVGPFTRLSVDGAPVYADAVSPAFCGLGVITAEEPQRFIYTCDDGESWTEVPLPVPTGVNSFSMDWRLTLATDDGGFISIDEGASWIALADTGSDQTGSARIATSDLGVNMVSPSPVNGGIMNTTSRFELDVTNHGLERVEDILVGLDFVTWRDGSTQGGSSFGTSLQINGVDCSRDVDWVLFPDKIAQCELEFLEPGESARIVWIHGLPADAFSMRLEAKVASHKLRDTHLNNDSLDFSPNVRSVNDIPGGSGGGGATGILSLLALFVCGRRRHVRRGMIR